MPYELVFRILARLSSGDLQLRHEKMETYFMYMEKLNTKFHEMCEIARQNFKAFKEKSKEY